MTSMGITEHETQKQMAQVGIVALVIINKRGKVLNSFGENYLNLSKEKREILFMQTALQCSMQDEHNDDFGRMHFCLTKRDKSKFVCKQIGADRIAVAIATNHADDVAVIEYVDGLRRMYDRTVSGKMEHRA